jgi:hypothetical protein
VDLLLLLLPVALSSAGALYLGRRRGIPAAGLRRAFARLCECVGLMVAFVALNTLLGVAFTLLARRLTHRFVSLYMVTDSVLLGLSALQAVALRWWWGERDGNGATACPRQPESSGETQRPQGNQ